MTPSVAIADHLRLIEREFGGRLTPDDQQAVADALAGFWHDDPDGAPTPWPEITGSLRTCRSGDYNRPNWGGNTRRMR